MTDDLMAFLRARLDEDERVARAAAGAPWEIEIPPMVHVSVKARRDAKWKWGRLGYVATVERDEDRAHIARHDPARVLVEIDAKRQLVKLHGRATLRAGGGARHFDTTTVCRSCEPNHQFPELSWPCPTLRLLALPYADHPDYREEWRPGLA